jgi:hypothetical protein
MSGIIDYVLIVAEALPVVSALIVLMYSAHAVAHAPTKYRAVLVGFVCAMFLLLVAQTSWSIAFLIYDDRQTMWWADRIWSAFNFLVTVLGFMVSRIAIKESKGI